MAHTLINPLYPRPHIAAGASSVASGVMLTISSSSAATSFTSSQFDTNCQLVFLDIQNNNALVTFDGTTPVQFTNGHNLAAGTNYTWQLATLLDAKFVSVSATTSYVYASQITI